jgi:hypothetical protein
VVENLDCLLHGVPVGAGTHDDADLWFHVPILLFVPGYSK